MARALQDKAVYVCPLIYGVGIRTRLFEPMAHGIPVVSTRMGAEGIEVVHGEHVLLADDPGEFAEAVLVLLRQPELRARLARGAHELVKRRYTWEAYARGMERLYEEALRKRKAETGARRVA
jgi:glycosyltransferase involved in cell wall biosynthesis